MPSWNQDAAIGELDRLCQEAVQLGDSFPSSTEHTRWLFVVLAFLRDVFGEASLYYVNFRRIRWRHEGPMLLDYREAFAPYTAEARYHQPVYLQGLLRARGTLLAAKDELQQKGIEGVYQGKDTGPEASLLLRIINLAEMKLRKTIREKPAKEKDVQDAFENLLIGADIPYSRETESIEYSSKTYRPDFTVQRADLAIDMKLCDTADDEKAFIPQINDDILAYRTKYGNLFFIVYDCGFIRDTERFASSFESQGAVYVRVVKQ